MKRALLVVVLALLVLLAATTQAAGDAPYTVVRQEAARLWLFWLDDQGRPLRRLDAPALGRRDRLHDLGPLIGVVD